jgi:hypothetical protein
MLPRKASRSRRPPTLTSDGSRKTGSPGRRVGVEPRVSPPASATNRKGVLAGHEDEIARLYAGGNGRRVSSIARTFGVSSNAINKCLSLPARGPGKNSQFGKRYSKCVRCWGPIRVNGSATRGYCNECIELGLRALTIYDRDAGIGEIPETLRRYSLQG